MDQQLLRHKKNLRMCKTYLIDINNYVANIMEEYGVKDYDYAGKEEMLLLTIHSMEMLLKAGEMVNNRK